jgi:hypothetical protein
VVSVTPLPLFTPGERTPGNHCTGGRVGPRAGLDTEDRGKILSLCRRQNLGRLVCSHIPPSPQKSQCVLNSMFADLRIFENPNKDLRVPHVTDHNTETCYLESGHESQTGARRQDRMAGGLSGGRFLGVGVPASDLQPLVARFVSAGQFGCPPPPPRLAPGLLPLVPMVGAV